jgi:hypothetical protein
MPGPIPKRSDQRRRTNKPPAGQQLTTAKVSGVVKVPPATRTWHPIARGWYKSLAESAQSVYYEPSDWAQARLIAESMTRMLNDDDFKASSLQAVMAGMTELLTSEGARRRARLEIQRETEQPAASVTPADGYRDRLGVA